MIQFIVIDEEKERKLTNKNILITSQKSKHDNQHNYRTSLISYPTYPPLKVARDTLWTLDCVAVGMYTSKLSDKSVVSKFLFG